jgi:prepilin-type N-terminal cleavage/methylation domain-containing protein
MLNQAYARRCGLTLIELLVVIAGLSMLAAFAVPRFQALEVDSRGQDSEALAQSVRAAAQLSHGLWLSQGKPSDIVFRARRVPLQFGFPTEAGIQETLAEWPDFTFSAGRWLHTGAADPTRCSVRYYAPVAEGQNPAVIALTDGC